MEEKLYSIYLEYYVSMKFMKVPEFPRNDPRSAVAALIGTLDAGAFAPPRTLSSLTPAIDKYLK